MLRQGCSLLLDLRPCEIAHIFSERFGDKEPYLFRGMNRP